jgi:hypothetical protein
VIPVAERRLSTEAGRLAGGRERRHVEGLRHQASAPGEDHVARDRGPATDRKHTVAIRRVCRGRNPGTGNLGKGTRHTNTRWRPSVQHCRENSAASLLRAGIERRERLRRYHRQPGRARGPRGSMQTGSCRSAPRHPLTPPDSISVTVSVLSVSIRIFLIWRPTANAMYRLSGDQHGSGAAQRARQRNALRQHPAAAARAGVRHPRRRR